MAKFLTEDIIPSLKEKVPQLYDNYGTNTDGSVTQNFINGRLNSKELSLGESALADGTNSTALGAGASVAAVATNGAALGPYTRTLSQPNGTSIGAYAICSSKGSVALGAYSQTTRAGEIYVGTRDTNYGYNDTALRVIGGVHPGVNDDDAVTVGQLNETVGDINTILEQYDTGAGV